MKFKAQNPGDFQRGDLMVFKGNLFVFRRILRWIKHRVFRVEPRRPVMFTVVSVDKETGTVTLQ